LPFERWSQEKKKEEGIVENPQRSDREFASGKLFQNGNSFAKTAISFLVCSHCEAFCRLLAENAGIRTPDLTRTALSEPEAGARNDSVGGMGDIAGKTMV
jgi:hypothetical protein